MPPPKPPGQRRRRNLDAPKWKTLAPGGKVPVMPGPKPGKDAKDYWVSIWSSPMSGMFVDADRFPISRAARIHERAVVDEATAAELTELRNLESSLGISPLARRKLQWEVEKAAGPGSATARMPVDDELAKRRAVRRRVAECD